MSRPLTIDFRQARSARLIIQDDRLDWIGRCLVGDLDSLPGHAPGVDDCVIAEWAGRTGHASSYGLLGATAEDAPTHTTINLGSDIAAAAS